MNLQNASFASPFHAHLMTLTSENQQPVMCEFNTTQFNNFQSEMNCLNVNTQGYQVERSFTTGHTAIEAERPWCGKDCSVGNETIVNITALGMKVNSVTGQTSSPLQGLPKRFRTTFSPPQLNRLESEFQCNNYIVGLKRMRLAEELKLEEKQVKIWFQNRRMKLKRDRQNIQRKILAHNPQHYF